MRATPRVTRCPARGHGILIVHSAIPDRRRSPSFTIYYIILYFPRDTITELENGAPSYPVVLPLAHHELSSLQSPTAGSRSYRCDTPWDHWLVMPSLSRRSVSRPANDEPGVVFSDRRVRYFTIYVHIVHCDFTLSLPRCIIFACTSFPAEWTEREMSMLSCISSHFF